MVRDMIAISSKISNGMTMGEVLSLLGTPSKAESFQIDGNEYVIWIFSSRTGTDEQIVWFDADHKVRSHIEREVVRP